MSLFRRSDPTIRMEVSALTDVGRTRSHNEDRYLVADLTSRERWNELGLERLELGPKGALLLVADGMGGAAGGERASQMAADLIYEHVATGWTSDPDLDPELFAARLREAVERANARIHAVANQQPELQGMGTTATMVGVLGQRLLLSQVGDSRAYLVRARTAFQLSRDQSFLQHLLDTGRVSEEEAHEIAPKNMILQALGPEATVEVVQSWQPIYRDDIVLLCSDGLSGLVNDEDIAEIVGRAHRLSKACQALVDLANQRGGPDNITVVLARFDGSGLDRQEDAETV